MLSKLTILICFTCMVHANAINHPIEKIQLTETGNVIKLTCNFTDNTDKILWKIPKEAEGFSYVEPNIHTSVLSIENPKRSHAGKYTCHDNSSVNIKVFEVEVKPIVRLFHIPSGIKADRTVTLKCDYLDTFPIPEIIWLKNDSEVSQDNTTFSNGTQMIIFKFNAENDTGNYTCTAKNSLGSYSSSVYLTICDETMDAAIIAAILIIIALLAIGGSIAFLLVRKTAEIRKDMVPEAEEADQKDIPLLEESKN